MWCDVMVLYELALMGAASDAQAGELQKDLTQVIAPFGLRLGHEVEYRGEGPIDDGEKSIFQFPLRRHHECKDCPTFRTIQVKL
jgi:hypothetical protein